MRQMLYQHSSQGQTREDSRTNCLLELELAFGTYAPLPSVSRVRRYLPNYGLRNGAPNQAQDTTSINVAHEC